jgi:plasmid stabilization system protein ParE
MQLRWAFRARADMLAIAEYYEGFAPGVADRLLEKIEAAPLLLLDHPNLGSAAGRGRYRKWTVRGTPFIVIYRALPLAIEVARVRHAATDWRKRR